jgi:Tfp pilus assembly protein PilF
MNTIDNSPAEKLKKRWLLGFLSFAFIVFIYSNTLSIPWILDDLPNIVKNTNLHLHALTPDALIKTLSAHPNGKSVLYRPLACLTFALNWYVGADRVFGYHVVNLIIHLATALFLYLTLLNLHRSPRLAARFENRNVYSIALLATLFWAANPVQTQAVNYIVQRMATLAAMFSVLGIYFYVKARLSRSEYRCGAFYLAGGVSFVCALASKENAAILPLSIVLTEIIFFQTAKSLWKLPKLIGFVLGACLAVLGVVCFFYDLNPLFFLQGYNSRPFTLSERLLTEARILVFYLSQIFYPHPERLSIAHDVSISRSLIDPWMTLPAVILIFALLGLSVWRMHRNPIASFACLFFFLNHIVESTVIPLELLFEHRNYLPSLFLFWPIAVGCHSLLIRFRNRKRLRYAVLVTLPLILIGLGWGTYWRNDVWKTDRGLWEDALQKAPQYKRPYQQLATYYQKQGQFDKAIELLVQSKDLTDENPRVSRMVYYNNMGNILIQKGNYDKAIVHLEKLLADVPEHRIGRGNMIVALMKSQQWSQASDHIDYLLKKRYNNYKYPNLKGVILVQLNQLPEAQRYFRQALDMAPLVRDNLVNFCAITSMRGEYARAQTCLTRALQFYPDDRSLLLRLVENEVRRGNPDAAQSYMERLKVGSALAVSKMLSEESQNLFLVPPSADLVLSVFGTNPQPVVVFDEQDAPGSTVVNPGR